MSSPESARRYSAPALTKGLRLLEVLAASPSAMTQADLARSLEKSPAEIFRMLSVLGQEGYVVRDSRGAYLPALKLFTLGRTVDPFRALLAAAEGPMREFAQATGQECHLSVLDGGALVVLAQESGAAPVTIRISVGSRHDPRFTASGKLLLALLDPEKAAREIKSAREQFGGRLPVAATLRRELGRIAAAGYSEGHNASRLGLADTAVPLPRPGILAHAALASSHFIAESRGERSKQILRQLRKTAEIIGKDGSP
jgi:DNA-binding IclR family transcriptional regulator